MARRPATNTRTSIESERTMNNPIVIVITAPDLLALCAVLTVPYIVRAWLALRRRARPIPAHHGLRKLD